MGTRSITVFVDEEDEEIVVMYRQYDGYIEYYGKRLCEYLQSFEKVVNGMQGETTKIANTMGCLSAQVIMHMKSEIKRYDYNNRVFNPKTGNAEPALLEGNHEGGIYLYPAGTRSVGEAYIYVVKSLKKGITLEAYSAGHKEWTYKGETHLAVPDELIHKGLVSDNWFEKALKQELRQ
jgi:hypothetical protein